MQIRALRLSTALLMTVAACLAALAGPGSASATPDRVAEQTSEYAATKAAAAKAPRWKHARTNCQQRKVGRICLHTQRRGKTAAWRGRLAITAKKGRWVRAYRTMSVELTDTSPASRVICTKACPRVRGRSWTSKWVAGKPATGRVSALFYTSAAKGAQYINVGLTGFRHKSTQCSSTRRVCAALYAREFDDKRRWQGRVALTPAEGSWIAPVRAVLTVPGRKVKRVRVFDNQPRTSRWTARTTLLVGPPIGAKIRFTYRSPKGTFTIVDDYKGYG